MLDPEKRSPDLLEQDGAQGIEGLNGRVSRYGIAKKTALDVADYMATTGEHVKQRERMQTCGDYLLFRHYYTIDEVRLHAASFCKQHLLCSLCAIRRGSKALGAYLERFEVINSSERDLRPFLVTLTVKDGPDLLERYEHLKKAQHELWKRRHRVYASALDDVAGAVWSYEVKRGNGSGLWHPHLHMIALSAVQPDQARLSAEWREITGDSFIVDVRPINQDDPASGFAEVFKYAVKFSDQDPADTVHCWRTLRRRRLLGSAGCFRGVDVPEALTDEALELPFIAYLYRYLRGARGYVDG